MIHVVGAGADSCIPVLDGCNQQQKSTMATGATGQQAQLNSWPLDTAAAAYMRPDLHSRFAEL